MKGNPMTEPLTAAELARERKRHSGQPQCRTCMQPQPCQPSRWIATLDAARQGPSVDALAEALHADVCDCPGDDRPGCHLRRFWANWRAERILARLSSAPAGEGTLTRAIATTAGDRLLAMNAGRDAATVEWLTNDIRAIEQEEFDRVMAAVRAARLAPEAGDPRAALERLLIAHEPGADYAYEVMRCACGWEDDSAVGLRRVDPESKTWPEHILRAALKESGDGA